MPQGASGFAAGATVLVASAGTFCDASIVGAAVAALRRAGARVACLVDEPQAAAARRDAGAGGEVHTYRAPAFVTRDVELGAADTSASAAAWAAAHPVQAFQARRWVREVAERLRALERRLRPAAVVVHYALLPALFRLGPAHLAASAAPHVVLHMAPGVPNATAPWVFDGRVRDRRFALFEPPSRAAAADSWAELLRRAAPGAGGDAGAEAAACALRGLHHALCWDEGVAPPLEPLPGLGMQQLDVRRVGALEARTEGSRKGAKLPPELAPLAAFLAEQRAAGRRAAMCSFGSFAAHPGLRALLPALFARLADAGYAVVFHDTAHSGVAPPTTQRESESRSPATPYLRVAGHVPYAWAVPRVQLVAFTGSLCLQATCFRHAVPMVFLPLLTEQHFWARAYRRACGVEYAAPHDQAPAAARRSLAAAVRDASGARALAHVRAVSRAARARGDAAAALARLVAQLAREAREGAAARW